MKIKILAVILLGAMFAGLAAAQTNVRYTWSIVSVTSASVPVQVLPYNRMTSWYINEHAANAAGTPAAENILVWSFDGSTVPTSVPSACASPSATFTAGGGCTEVTPTKPLSDAITCDQPTCNDAIGQGFAAVLENGSTAVTVSSGYR